MGFFYIVCLFSLRNLFTPPIFLVSLFLNFIKGFIHFFFKDLYYLHKVDFKDFFLCPSLLEYSELAVVG